MSISNRCNVISDFYKCHLGQGKVIATESTGPFGGKKVEYTVATEMGAMKVKCNSGLDSWYFANLSITPESFVSGVGVSGFGGLIGSAGAYFDATKISPVTPQGVCEIQTVFTKAILHLPVPKK